MGSVMMHMLMAVKAKVDPPLKAPGSDPYEGLSPEQMVHAAACNDDVKTLERLAQEGADLNAPREPDGLLALDATSWSGCAAGSFALLRLGADASATQQAVCGAAAWGKAELLEALLDAGGPLDQELSQSTPLRWSVEMGHEDCSLVLQRKGAWKVEPDQEYVLRRAKGKRMAQFLQCVAEEDPKRAAACVLPPYWKTCDIL
mmetsp:Transcript_1815/g.4035  ORF Transcript_1815/g.4035 Transcript_1815/m.4035 type:complete len:202 (+) Transcript_1815:75-680(+)